MSILSGRCRGLFLVLVLVLLWRKESTMAWSLLFI